MSQDFKYIYLRDKELSLGENRRGFPVACIAILVDRNANEIHYGLATVHPDDRSSHYNRENGKALAVGRLMLRHNVLEMPKKTYVSMRDVTRMIMADIAKQKDSPTRAKKAAKRWMKFAEEADEFNSAFVHGLYDQITNSAPLEETVASVMNRAKLFD